MDFAYSDEQSELRRLAKEVFASADDVKHLEAVESEPDWFDTELWQRLASTNLLGVTIPVADGGLGFGILEACLVAEQCGRTLGHVPLIPTIVGGVMPVARFGSDEHRRELLGGVLGGETRLTAAPGQDGDPPLLAHSDGSGWVLEGQVPFVPWAHLAQAVVVPASEGNDRGLFLVPLGPDTSRERQVTMSGDPQFVVGFDGTSATALVSPGPAGDAAVAWLRQLLQVAHCALELGIAEAALRMTARYTSQRVQFERPIATFQAVGHRMADSYIDVLAMRWTMLEAAAALASGESADEAVCTAKWWACDGGHRVVSAAQHCHGGVGVDMSYPLYRHFLWSKQVEVTLGSGAQLLAELGQRIAGGGPIPAVGP